MKFLKMIHKNLRRGITFSLFSVYHRTGNTPFGLYRVRARNYDFFLMYKIKTIYLREQKDRF